MSYKLAEGAPHPEPITDCGPWGTDVGYAYCYRYHVTCTSTLPKLNILAAEFQDSIFFDGAVTAGFFRVVGSEPAPGKGWLWHIVLERPDCESDFHNCYAEGHGHDGGDEGAIAQLQGELDEALQDAELPLIENVKVVSRHVMIASEVQEAMNADSNLLEPA